MVEIGYIRESREREFRVNMKGNAINMNFMNNMSNRNLIKESGIMDECQ